MDDLVGEFISETSESLAALEGALRDSAQHPLTPEAWDQAIRLMHTIKSTCGFLRFATMESVAMRCEQALQQARHDPEGLDAEKLRALRGVLAQISYMMQHLARHGSELSAPPPVPELDEPAANAAADHTAEKLREQLYYAPLSNPARATAMVPRAAEAAEHVALGTLQSLVELRNRLLFRLGDDDGDAKLLDRLVRQFAQPHRKQTTSYPRLADIMVVRGGPASYAIEQEAVRQVVRIGPDERLTHLNGGAMISIHGKWLPRLSLAQRLDGNGAADDAYAVVVQQAEGLMALCVREIEALPQVMLRPVPRLLQSARLYSAATILGNGSPCLILRPEALLAAPDTEPVIMREAS